MPITIQLEISNEQLHRELGRVLRAGSSLDRYVEARRVLGLGVKNALRYAAIETGRTRLDTFKDALDLGLRPDEILGLAETRHNLTYITRLMEYAGATLDQAIEAHYVAVIDMGVFAYVGLRQKGASHKAIITAWQVAVRHGLRKDFFMAYIFAVKLSEAEAIEITQTELSPAIYVAAINQGYIHTDIVARHISWPDDRQFVRQIETNENRHGSLTVAEIQHQLSIARF